MSHHTDPNPMKGHHHPLAEKRGGWNLFNRIRRRSDASDRIATMRWPYPGITTLLSGHRDAPLSPLARLLWWLAGAAIISGGILLIILWMR